MKKKSARFLAMLLAMLMALSLLAACGGNNQGNQGGSAQNNGGSQGNEDAAGQDSGTSADASADGEKVLRLTFGDTPDTLNCQTTSSSYELVSNWTAKLYRYIWDEESGTRVLVPEIADGEPVPENPDDLRSNMVWTFKVAQGYTFADGTPIDAHTVEYSIRMLNDPKLANRNVNASEFENGVAYLTGECEWEDVGFKVLDDYTIQITYADGHQPRNAHDAELTFENIGAGIVHPDMYESCLSADGTSTTYATTRDTIVCSGTYEITGLIAGQYLELTKRTDSGAPQTDVYTPDKVTYTAVSDTNTAIQLFESGEIDMVAANGEAYDDYAGAHYLYQAFTNGIFLNSINPSVEVLKDPNFRYAMFWGYDRERIQQALARSSLATSCHNLPFAVIPDPATDGNTYTPYMETPEAKAIRMDGHDVSDGICYDPDLALEYFNKAYEANGGEKITITALYYDGNGSSTASTLPEAIQANYQDLFGEDRFELVLQATPWSVMSQQLYRTAMSYDIAFSNSIWNNATEPWASSNFVYGGTDEFNTQYCIIANEDWQKEWSDLYYNCSYGDYKFDPQKCVESTARMEEILYNDCSFIPTHVSGTRYFFSSRVTPLMDEGDPDLEFAVYQIKFN